MLQGNTGHSPMHCTLHHVIHRSQEEVWSNTTTLPDATVNCKAIGHHSIDIDTATGICVKCFYEVHNFIVKTIAAEHAPQGLAVHRVKSSLQVDKSNPEWSLELFPGLDKGIQRNDAINSWAARSEPTLFQSSVAADKILFPSIRLPDVICVELVYQHHKLQHI